MGQALPRRRCGGIARSLLQTPFIAKPNPSSQTPAATCTAIEALRRQRHTGKQIATEVKVSPATVSRVLRRLGLNRIRDLEPAEPERRYERESPGEIIHIDIKKLGRFERVGHRISGDRSGPNKSRGAGWDFVHVCIDDHSRVAFSAIKPDETADSALARRRCDRGGDRRRVLVWHKAAAFA